MLVLLGCLPAAAQGEATLRIGSVRATADQVETARRLIQDAENLGTDPPSGIVGPALDRVASGETSYIQFTNTGYLSNPCALTSRCADLGEQTICSDRGLDTVGARVSQNRNACRFQCLNENDPFGESFWVEVRCQASGASEVHIEFGGLVLIQKRGSGFVWFADDTLMAVPATDAERLVNNGRADYVDEFE